MRHTATTKADSFKLKVVLYIARYKAAEEQGLAPAVDAIQKEADGTPFEEQKKQIQVCPKPRLGMLVPHHLLHISPKSLPIIQNVTAHSGVLL